MVLFNYSTKELTAKVVYYGPGLCGKTTNLHWIHEKLPIKNKGKMLSLATETDRTLFFDFLPIEIGAIRGMKTRIQLYTVPGQVFYNATRRMVLKGADAVVFVCDSQEAMLDANQESFENMRQNLEANEIDPDEIPIVFQYNKRDLPNALPIEILNERMNPRGYPFNEAIAVTGAGVENTLKAVTKLVFKSLSATYGAGTPARTPPPARRAPAPPRATPPPPPPKPPPSGQDSLVLAVDGQEIEIDVDAAPMVVVREGTPNPARAQRPQQRSPIAVHDPQGTLVSSRNEAEDLRRRIANPGIPEAEVEVDLEEIDEVADSRPGTAPPSPAPVLSAPPVASPLRTSPPLPPRGNPAAPSAPTEVEVPIDVEVPAGTSSVRLNLRLILNLKRR
jgi:signal recognition particle receptor subunit beta